MAVHASHAALPYPIKGARYSMLVPYLDADGDPTAPTTPDTEVSEDNGAATDAAEEASATSGMDGMALITFSGAETDCSCLAVNFKASSGPKATLATLYPRVLAVVGSGTLSAGSSGGGTLGTLLAYDVTGCFVKTTGGTGGGGTGGADNQVRKIITYNTGTGAFTVAPNWETTPSTDTTYEVLLPEGVTLGMLKALNPTTAGRTLDVSSGGEAGLDWANVGSPTTTLNLSGTTVGVVTDLADGAINAATLSSDTITAAKIASDALTAAKFAADCITAAKIASDVGTEIATAVWASGTRTLTALGFTLAASDLAADTITAAKVAADVTTELQSGLATAASLATVAGYLDTEVAAILAVTNKLDDCLEEDAGTSGLWRFSKSAVRQVWDSTLTEHLTAGTTGAALNSASSAGDPWNTALPGAYGAGTAGYIVGNSLDATVSSRASQTSLNTLDDYVDTELAAILAVTNKLDDCLEEDAGTSGLYRFSRSAVRQVWDALTADHATAGTYGLLVTTLSTYVDTEVAAIKAKTDQLTFSTSNRVDCQVYGMEAGTVTATAIATGAVDADALAADAGTEIAAAVWAAGTRTLTALGFTLAASDLAADTITAAKVAADVTTELQSGLATAASLATVAGYLDTEVAAILAVTNKLDDCLEEDAGTSGLWRFSISAVRRVWDATITDHLTGGSTGAALNAAGSAGDPWSTPLPGAYGSGTAGFIIGTNLNATVSSRASQTSLDTLDDYVDTEVAAIKAKTDQLTFSTSNRVDCQVFGMEANTVTASAVAADAIDASALASDAVTEISSGIATAVWAAGTRTLTALGFTLGASDLASDTITAAKVASDVGTEIATAVWASGTRTLSALGFTLAAADLAADTITAAKVASDVGTEIATAVWASGTRTLTALGFTLAAADLATDTITAAKLAADAVSEIQSGLATSSALSTVAGYIDTEVAAIKAKTDSLTFSTANRVDAQVFGMENNTVTAAAVADGAIDAGAIADNAITAAKIATDAITAAKIATGAIDADAIAADAANEIADALLDRSAGVETNRTLRQALRLILAACAGKLSGAATTTVTIRDTNDGVNRIVATVDEDGNRTAVTLDAS